MTIAEFIEVLGTFQQDLEIYGVPFVPDARAQLLTVRSDGIRTEPDTESVRQIADKGFKVAVVIIGDRLEMACVLA